MTTYRARPHTEADGPKVGDIHLYAVEGNQEIPIGFITVKSEEFPFDSQQLSENLADVLNGNEPTHIVDGEDHQVFYQRLPQGIRVNWQNGSNGISRPGLLALFVERGTAADFAHAAREKLDDNAMKKFCSAVDVTPVPLPDLAPSTGTPSASPAFNP